MAGLLVNEEKDGKINDATNTSVAAVTPSQRLQTNIFKKQVVRLREPAPLLARHPTSQTSQPHLHLISPYASPPVRLLVGGPASPSPEQDPVALYVHADFLTSISPFFRAAFSSSDSTAPNYGFKESQTRTMTLPEDRPDDIRFLLQWAYWRAAGLPLQKSSSETQVPSSASITHYSSACLIQLAKQYSVAHGLWHVQIDPALTALHKYRHERALVAKAEVHGDISQLIMPRPTTPTFGPLVRLWLFAERYDVRGGLKDEICDRILEVSRFGNAVPGKEDVEMLWDGTFVIDGKAKMGLRALVLDLYVGMRCFGHFDGEEGQWHKGFLIDLVRKLMSEIHGEWDAKNGSVASTAKKEDGDGCEAKIDEEIIMVGRLRRKRCEYHEHA